MRTSPAVLREINERRLLNEMRMRGVATRSELQASMGLALPTILRVVDALIERGWLRETGRSQTKGGRPAQIVELVPEGGYALGIDFGRDLVRLICVDLSFQTVLQEDVTPERFQRTDDLLIILQEFIDRSEINVDRIVGVGIGAPNTSDPQSGTFLEIREISPIWQGFPVGPTIESYLNVPVYLTNDADAAALGEWWIASPHNIDSILFVLLDAGVGAGWVVDGQVYSGAHNQFGEISQMVVCMDDTLTVGPEHTMNVIAAHVLMQAIAAEREMTQGETLGDCFLRAQSKGEPDFSIFRRAVNAVAVGLSNLTQVLDPHRIVLGGRTISQLPGLFDWIATQYKILQPNTATKLEESTFGDKAVVMGAVALVFQNVFASDLVLSG